MFFKRFRFQVIGRILVLTIFLALFLFLLLNTRYYAAILLLAGVLMVQVFGLIRYVQKTIRDLDRFFSAIRQSDFSQVFSGQELGPSFADLVGAFNEVMEKIKQVRYEREEQSRYLQTILHHLDIGLITFSPDGAVDLINPAARRLLGVFSLRNIKSLAAKNPILASQLLHLKPGDRALVKLPDSESDLVVRAAEFRLKDKLYTLISLQDIRGELEEKEMEAWQNLIRVMTHEIMNSMTPISSMAGSILNIIENRAQLREKGAAIDLPPGEWQDITAALQTIQKRSEGLTHFVGAYRNLAMVPNPAFRLVLVEELFDRVENLMEKEFKDKGIAFERAITPRTLELFADPELIEQVLINLLLNAVEALTGRPAPRIALRAGQDEAGRVLIQVADNGPGIAGEALHKVFIPFFTTRKKGSGIGLSLSRQVMKLHHGAIFVHSEPDRETVFTLRF